MNIINRRTDMEEGKVPEYSRGLKRPTHKSKGIAAMAAVKALVKGAPHGKLYQEQNREPGGVHDRDISLNTQLNIKHENPFDDIQDHVSHFERESSLIAAKRHSFRTTQDVERSDSLDWGYPTTRNQHSELADIESYLDRAKSELPELQGPKNESAEDSVIRIIQTYKRISGSLRDSKGRLEPVDKLKENYQRAEDELRVARQENKNWKNFYEGVRQQFDQKVIDLNDEKDALNARYEQSLKQARDVTATQSEQISDLTAKMKSLENDKFHFQKELETRALEFSQQLSKERAMSGAQTQDLNNKFGDRVKETSEMFERRLQHEKIENEARLQEAESRNELVKQQVEQIKRDHEDEINKLQLEMEQSQQKAREQMKQQLEEQKANEEILLERKHEQMRQQILMLDARLTKERERQRVTIQELQKEHKAESNRQKVETELHFKREFVKHEEMVRSFKTQHKAELDRQSADAEKRVKEVQKRYEEEVRYMKATFLELAELKKAVDQQIPKPQHVPSLKKRLGDKSGADIRQLRALKEDYKKALSDQHYLSLKDHHIVTRFKTIASEIERLARIEWDGHRAAHWPCTENNLLRLNPQNTRKLKQYIVQSSLWVFLYERIFRSPFCMFGHEGAEMDRDWEDIYSLDAFPRKWPDVLPAVEDKRCANAKRCLVVIDPSTEAAPENVELKASYELLITAAVEAFSKLMENITSFGEAGRKTVSTIMRLCAKVWLECCSQRYRLMVRVLVSGGNILHFGPRVVPSLSLLRLPELKRYGTLQGGNFEKEETIDGWKGAVVVFPTQ